MTKKILTPVQQRHANAAEKLQIEAAKALDKVKHESPKAAVLIRKANQELEKAGLIKGKLTDQK